MTLVFATLLSWPALTRGKSGQFSFTNLKKSPIPNSLVKSCDFLIDFCCYCGFVAAARKDKKSTPLSPSSEVYYQDLVVLLQYSTISHNSKLGKRIRSRSVHNEREVWSHIGWRIVTFELGSFGWRARMTFGACSAL